MTAYNVVIVGLATLKYTHPEDLVGRLHPNTKNKNWKKTTNSYGTIFLPTHTRTSSRLFHPPFPISPCAFIVTNIFPLVLRPP